MQESKQDGSTQVMSRQDVIADFDEHIRKTGGAEASVGSGAPFCHKPIARANHNNPHPSVLAARNSLFPWTPTKSLHVRVANRARLREDISVISSVSIMVGVGLVPSHPGAFTSKSHVSEVARG
jgi:hypothetical protein